MRNKPITPLRALLYSLFFVSLFTLSILFLPRTFTTIPFPFRPVVEGILWIGEKGKELYEEGVRWSRTILFLFSRAKTADLLEEEVKTLKEENFLLKSTIRDWENLGILFQIQPFSWEGIPAFVVYSNPQKPFSTLWVRPLKPLSPDYIYIAIAPEGVVGRVHRKSGSFYQILTVGSEESAVDVETPRGIRGILRGEKGKGNLTYVPYRSVIEEGEPLFTSGKDGIYPRGISAGVIEKIVRNPDELFLKVTVRFSVDLSKLKRCLLIPRERPPFLPDLP